MIRADIEKESAEVIISGDSQVILRELHIIIMQLLKAFYSQDADTLVLQEIVDVIDEFKASITNTNFNSKGEKTND